MRCGKRRERECNIFSLQDNTPPSYHTQAPPLPIPHGGRGCGEPRGGCEGHGTCVVGSQAHRYTQPHCSRDTTPRDLPWLPLLSPPGRVWRSLSLSPCPLVCLLVPHTAWLPKKRKVRNFFLQ